MKLLIYFAVQVSFWVLFFAGNIYRSNALILTSFIRISSNTNNCVNAYLTSRGSDNRNKKILLSLEKKGIKRYRYNVTKLYVKQWWEDDLPNILGINPFEAAIIFGVLYYIYGPNVLYEYARDAGKFVSTYAPIVKDVSLDIFNEFKDYLEEDREREMLSKQGVDVSSMPRRTSNILERFQEGIAAFSEVTSDVKDGAKAELRNAYSSDVDNRDKMIDRDDKGEADVELSKTSMEGKRRSKKEVLAGRNVDIDKVISASQSTMSSTTDAELAESLSLVQNRINALTDSYSLQQKQDEPPKDYNFPSEYDSNADLSVDSAVPMSKFQQQMSGNWNIKVMKQNYSNTFIPDEYGMSDTYTSFPPVPSDWTSSDIPMELSSLDDDVLPNISPNGDIGKVLNDFDRDYLHLRQRLVDALRKFEDKNVESGSNNSSTSSSAGRSKYWPPRKTSSY